MPPRTQQNGHNPPHAAEDMEQQELSVVAGRACEMAQLL